MKMFSAANSKFTQIAPFSVAFLLHSIYFGLRVVTMMHMGILLGDFGDFVTPETTLNVER
jgi:hypothetical protein